MVQEVLSEGGMPRVAGLGRLTMGLSYTTSRAHNIAKLHGRDTSLQIARQLRTLALAHDLLGAWNKYLHAQVRISFEMRNEKCVCSVLRLLHLCTSQFVSPAKRVEVNVLVDKAEGEKMRSKQSGDRLRRRRTDVFHALCVGSHHPASQSSDSEP